MDEEALISLDPASHRDLQWWSDTSNLTPGVSLKNPHPDVYLYTDASNQGWGATLDDHQASGKWSMEIQQLSINYRELLAVQMAISHFLPHLEGLHVAFCDNVTTVSYLKKAGGTRSSVLNDLAQKILRFCESHLIHLLPQFVAGALNVEADALSRSNQVLGAEWRLAEDVFLQLLHRWPATIDLFATRLNHQLPVYFSPVADPMSVGIDAMMHPWDNLQTYAFPPFGMIHQVLNKLRMSSNTEMTLIAPFWAQKPWFPDLLELLLEPPIPLPNRKDLLRQPHFHRFHQNLHVLQLYAWRLSKAPPEPSDSLRQWLANLPSAEGSQLV